MSLLPKVKSWSTAKLVIFYLGVAWIYYDITVGQQERAKQQVNQIKFKNVEFEYILKAGNAECNDKKLLIAIVSAPEAVERRNIIRNTWLKNINSTIAYRFFVGSSLNVVDERNSHNEAQTHEDFIATGILNSRMLAVYRNYAILKWQQVYCSTPKYIWLVDDNTIANISRLQYWIENEFDHIYKEYNGKVMFCRTQEILDNIIRHKLKWNDKNGVEFCEEPTYLLSTKAARLMLSKVKDENMISSFQDIMFTGLLAEATGVKRFHKPKHFLSKTIELNCGCDKNGEPYIISVRALQENSTYADEVKKYSSITCKANSNTTSLEYFKHCVAHSG